MGPSGTGRGSRRRRPLGPRCAQPPGLGPEGRPCSHLRAPALAVWLETGDWERSGSASFGRVCYEVSTSDGIKRGHFKARKNLIMDTTEFNDLYNRVSTYALQENRALIKSELGKIRIAVASPLETYLQMSWMYALGGSFYFSWPGNTLEEQLAREAARNERT